MVRVIRIRNQVDRISNLPDDILHHIISFLPLKTAVCTSILSTRWLQIVHTLPCLNFDDTYMWRKSDSQAYMEFVDRVLFYHTGNIDKLSLRCGDHVESNRIDRWIRYALYNGVRELDLRLLCKDFKDLNHLPLRVFTCNTLVKLKVGIGSNSVYLLKVPVKTSLTCLKILDLFRLELSDDNSVQILISSCPVLEEFTVDHCISNNNSKLSVIHPRLKRVVVRFCENYEEIHIDTPSLLYLEVFLPKRFLLKNLNSLVEAYICSKTLFDYYRSAVHLFQSLANVQSLHIYATYKKVVLQFSSHHPIFLYDKHKFNAKCHVFLKEILQGYNPMFELPNVTCLKVDGYMYDRWEEVLPDFLSCFPCIESLDILAMLHRDDNLRVVPPPGRFPGSLRSGLKKLGVHRIQGQEKKQQVIEFFLRDAQALEKLTAQIYGTERLKLKMRKRVLKMPKASPYCEINFI